jgi:hypothetical protein
MSILSTLFAPPTPQQVGSPESIARQRRVADAMIERGIDFSPIQSPTQGFARVAQALLGSYGDYRADQDEAAGRKAWLDNFNGAFGGGASATTPDTAGSSTPGAPTAPQTPDSGANLGTSTPVAMPHGDLAKQAFDYFTGKGLHARGRRRPRRQLHAGVRVQPGQHLGG